MHHFRVTFIAFCLLIAAQASIGQERKFGIGFIFGEPSGASAKYWTSSSTAFDFAIGWGSILGGGDSRGHFHMDYLWHSFDAISSSERFPVYYGVGGRVNTGGGSSFGARGVIGIAWMSRDTPIDIFVEFVPTLELAPSTDFVLEGGLGIRYFF